MIFVPFVAGPFDWRKYSDMSWFPWRCAGRSQGTIFHEGGNDDGVKLEVFDYVAEPEPRVNMQLTVDGQSEEFELAAAFRRPAARRPAARR